MSASERKKSAEVASDAEAAAMAEARRVVNAIEGEAASGELRWDAGASGELLRGLAFRVMVLDPVRRWLRARRDRRQRRATSETRIDGGVTKAASVLRN